MTNVKMMKRLIKLSESDIGLQIFLVAAFERYAQMVLADAPEKWKNAFVSKEMFDDKAKLVLSVMEEAYKENN